jgi:hypothetical protein
LLPWIAHLIVCSSQSNDPKIKIQKQKSHGLSTSFHLFSYIKKRDERDSEEKEERKKKQRRDREEIKTKI